MSGLIPSSEGYDETISIFGYAYDSAFLAENWFKTDLNTYRIDISLGHIGNILNI